MFCAVVDGYRYTGPFSGAASYAQSQARSSATARPATVARAAEPNCDRRPLCVCNCGSCGKTPPAPAPDPTTTLDARAEAEAAAAASAGAGSS